MPVVTTLTQCYVSQIQTNEWVMEQIAALSDRLNCHEPASPIFCQEVFQVSPEKIDLIPHGIPDLHFTDPNFYKDGFSERKEKTFCSPFGLSPQQGYRKRKIQALPSILSRHSSAV